MSKEKPITLTGQDGTTENIPPSQLLAEMADPNSDRLEALIRQGRFPVLVGYTVERNRQNVPIWDVFLSPPLPNLLVVVNPKGKPYINNIECAWGLFDEHGEFWEGQNNPYASLWWFQISEGQEPGECLGMSDCLGVIEKTTDRDLLNVRTSNALVSLTQASSPQPAA